jgi:hypothetical protein
VGLFYYAGHGIQVDGINYLIPIDADVQAKDEVRFSCIDANPGGDVWKMLLSILSHSIQQRWKFAPYNGS